MYFVSPYTPVLSSQPTFGMAKAETWTTDLQTVAELREGYGYQLAIQTSTSGKTRAILMLDSQKSLVLTPNQAEILKILAATRERALSIGQIANRLTLSLDQFAMNQFTEKLEKWAEKPIIGVYIESAGSRPRYTYALVSAR